MRHAYLPSQDGIVTEDGGCTPEGRHRVGGRVLDHIEETSRSYTSISNRHTGIVVEALVGIQWHSSK